MAKFTKPKPLNPNQKEFLRLYLLYRSPTKAYAEAYPNSKNPNVDGSQLLKHPEIQAAIKENELKLQKKFEVTEERIVKELMKTAFDDHMPVHIGDVLDWDEENITLIPKSEMKKLTMKYIKSLKQVIGKDGSRGIALEMKTFDKVKALAELRKHIGVWRPKNGGNEAPQDSAESGSSEDTGESVISRISNLAANYKKRE